jgi:hypothetical protein
MPPAEKATLADTFLAAEDLLYKTPDATEQTLRAALRHYTAYMVYTGLMGEEFAAVMVQTSQRLGVQGLRAALARTNCQLLRMISALPMCPLRCCCSCGLSPEGAGCCRWMTELGEQDPAGLVDPMPPGMQHG